LDEQRQASQASGHGRSEKTRRYQRVDQLEGKGKEMEELRAKLSELNARINEILERL
jgi:hypothetical protein